MTLCLSGLELCSRWVSLWLFITDRVTSLFSAVTMRDTSQKRKRTIAVDDRVKKKNLWTTSGGYALSTVKVRAKGQVTSYNGESV